MELMTHHVYLIRNLAETEFTPDEAAEWKVGTFNPEKYHTDEPIYRKQLEEALAGAVEEFRNGNVTEVPDYVKPDIICRNCNIHRCTMQANLRWRKHHTPYDRWEEQGISRYKRSKI